MIAQKPSLDLLRGLTDSHVIFALVHAGRLTRAEVSAATGISKPTITESVRRLEAAGVLVDTGERSPGPGRSGLYYDLSPTLGNALAIGIAPEGVVVEVVDVRGRVLARESARVSRPARPETVAKALSRTASAAAAAATVPGGATPPLRLAVVSAADPVDRATGRLVHLPDAPFLVGELDPAQALAAVVEGPVMVGNDVNWSALAERAANGDSPDDFAYLYLGEGLGCGLVAEGRVVQGSTGLAGEVAHVVVSGPRGRAMAFTEVFAELGLRHEGSAAIDVDRLLRHARGTSDRSRRVLEVVADAVAGVVAAIVSLTDPAEVVLGGPWGRDAAVVAAVRARVDASRRGVTVRAARVEEAQLAGARDHAGAALRELVVRDAVERRHGGPGHDHRAESAVDPQA